MADIRTVTDRFAVAPQVRPEELEGLKAQGYALVINNRPDGEEAGQPTSAQMEAAAREAGLDYLAVPVRGAPPSAEQGKAVAQAAAQASGKTLAFCRSGTRSIMAWSLGEAAQGRSPDELVRLGESAGYDLKPLRPMLEQVAGG